MDSSQHRGDDPAIASGPPPTFGRGKNRDSRVTREDVAAHAVLMLAAVWAAWRPVETRPWTAAVVAGVVLSLTVWGWRRSPAADLRILGAVMLALVTVTVSGLAGWDPSRAIGEIGLLAGVVGVVWLASRSRPPAALPGLLALGLAALAVWGLWQVGSGLESLRPGLDTMPEEARAYAAERLASRRAFASLPLPSHLAVVLATALPLLLTRVKRTFVGGVWAFATVLAIVGLAATRSPAGVGLAMVSIAALIVAKRWRFAVAVVGGLVVALIAVVAARPDVLRLEPVTLRVDNWHTALWLWTTAPSDGVGIASFAQASQALPLEVGNRPAHAHGLPMEALAELGPVGVMASLALALGLFQLMRSIWRDDRALAVAVAVVPLHNLVDFSIFVSGVALPWAVLLGWALACRREPMPLSAPVRGRVLAVSAVALAAGMTVLYATSVTIERSMATESASAARFDGALQALRLAPWRIEAQFLLSAAALDSKDRRLLDRAWQELNDRRWYRPGSAALAERRARVASARGDVSVAVSELWMAVEGGVSDPSRRDALDRLLVELEQASDDPLD